MFNIAADHITATENKERSERQAQQEHTDRVCLIGSLQRTIADAERRMVAPIFANEDTATTHEIMKGHIEKLANEYEHRLWQERQGGRKHPLDLCSEGAVAYFCHDLILTKLPVLADRITSRSGRGNGVFEAKRAETIAECEATIADAKAKLAELSILG